MTTVDKGTLAGFPGPFNTKMSNRMDETVNVQLQGLLKKISPIRKPWHLVPYCEEETIEENKDSNNSDYETNIARSNLESMRHIISNH